MGVLREFPEATTLHGVRHLARPGAPVFDRLCWAAALLTCAVCAAVFVGSAWRNYRLSPTLTSVDTTMYPLWKLSFPAVTICSSTNVKAALAEQLLLEFVGEAANSSATLLLQVRAALKALTKFRFPFYHEMQPHMEVAKPLLPRLDHLNVTDFMLTVMPTCEETFYKCFWQGRQQNCCEVFQLQRLDGGFCYSFNSLTSEETSHCVSRQARRALERAGRPIQSGPECTLRRNSGSGMSSGLEVFLRHPDAVQPLHRRQGRGYQVLLHDSTNFPQLGRGLFLPTRRGSKASGALKVVPSLTETAAAVRSVALPARGCFFPDERELRINAEYTLNSCLLECRLDSLLRLCRCLPYFFSIFDDEVPICNMSELMCIMKHAEEVRVPGPPPNTEGFEDPPALDCLWCLPACFARSYRVAATTNTAWDVGDDDYSAYVDIYYEEMGAIKYRRQLVVDTIDLIVSLGGIASLFLGVSLLTGVELLYYCWRLLRAALTSLHARVAATATASEHEERRSPSPPSPSPSPPPPLFLLRLPDARGASGGGGGGGGGGSTPRKAWHLPAEYQSPLPRVAAFRNDVFR